MTIDVRASGTDLQLWHVQLAGGVVRTMSLDELDGAFQSGTIDERTMVLKAGALHWTTLGDVAGIDDQPNSIAPMASDIEPSSVAIPPLRAPSFDVSFGTEELAVFKPKRRVGRALFAMALVASIGGGLFAVKSYGTDGLRAKVASVAAMVKGSGESARSAAMAPTPATQAEAPKAAEPLPAPIPTMTVSAAPPGVSIDSLPSASPDKKAKKPETPPRRVKATKAKGKSASKSSDPTLRGSGQFDPLNGAL